ncbi:MAG: hypothetical protein RLZZ135_2391 [Cyanobacteriota bacterium]|jgi:hypothetical protein
MTIDILKLPSGKIFDRNRFIALIPEPSPEYFQLYLAGCEKPLRIDRTDAMVIETTIDGGGELIFADRDIPS